jgi:hypothetical protein
MVGIRRGNVVLEVGTEKQTSEFKFFGSALFAELALVVTLGACANARAEHIVPALCSLYGKRMGAGMNSFQDN